jgi:hypothetical protein
MKNDVWVKVAASILSITPEEVNRLQRLVAKRLYNGYKNEESISDFCVASTDIIEFNTVYRDLYNAIGVDRKKLSSMSYEDLFQAAIKQIKKITPTTAINSVGIYFTGNTAVYSFGGEVTDLMYIDYRLVQTAEGTIPLFTLTFNTSVPDNVVLRIQDRFQGSNLVYSATPFGGVLTCLDRRALIDIAAGYYDIELDALLAVHQAIAEDNRRLVYTSEAYSFNQNAVSSKEL